MDDPPVLARLSTRLAPTSPETSGPKYATWYERVVRVGVCGSVQVQSHMHICLWSCQFLSLDSKVLAGIPIRPSLSYSFISSRLQMKGTDQNTMLYISNVGFVERQADWTR